MKWIGVFALSVLVLFGCEPMEIELQQDSVAASVGEVAVREIARDESVPDWENPEMIGQNKEPGHSTLIPYADVETALEGVRSESPFYESLNGEWKFNWVRKPAVRPVDFYKADYDVSGWDDIVVPSNWQMR